MDLTLIRHTRVAVPPGTCYGWTDVPVADTFLQEAEAVRQRLQGMSFDAVFTSPLTRARKLATFCGFPDAIDDPRLREMNMGEWEMQRYDDITDPHLQRWYDDYLHLPTTGGESFPMLYERVSAFLDEIRTRPYHHVAIFAHAGVLACAGIWAGLWKAEDAFSHQVEYGRELKLKIEN